MCPITVDVIRIKSTTLAELIDDEQNPTYAEICTGWGV